MPNNLPDQTLSMFVPGRRAAQSAAHTRCTTVRGDGHRWGLVQACHELKRGGRMHRWAYQMPIAGLAYSTWPVVGCQEAFFTGLPRSLWCRWAEARGERSQTRLRGLNEVAHVALLLRAAPCEDEFLIRYWASRPPPRAPRVTPVFHKWRSNLIDLSAIGYRLSAIGYRLSAIGYRLSAIGYRLSAIK